MNLDEQVVQIKIDLLEGMAEEDWRRCSSKLDRLSTMNIDLDTLSATKIGKVVSKLKKVDDRNVTNKAKVLISKWKKIAGVEEEYKAVPSQAVNAPCKKEFSSDLHSPSTSTHTKSLNQDRRISIGASAMKRPTPPQVKAVSIDAFNSFNSDAVKRQRTERAIRTRREAPKSAAVIGEAMQYGRNDKWISFERPKSATPDPTTRQKGIRATIAPATIMNKSGIVDTLESIAMRILIANIDYIEDIGEVPPAMLDPLFENCNQRQLQNLEYYNNHVLKHTDQFWQKFCKNKNGPRPQGGWRKNFEIAQANKEKQLAAANQSVRERYLAVQKEKQAKAVVQVELGRDLMRSKTGNHGRVGRATSSMPPNKGPLHSTGWMATKSVGSTSNKRFKDLREKMKKAKK
eukprot:CFRG3650T1